MPGIMGVPGGTSKVGKPFFFFFTGVGLNPCRATLERTLPSESPELSDKLATA